MNQEQDTNKIRLVHRDVVRQLSLMEKAAILLLQDEGKIRIVD